MSQKEINEGLLKLIELESKKVEHLFEMVEIIRKMLESFAKSIPKFDKDISNEKNDNRCPHGHPIFGDVNCLSCG